METSRLDEEARALLRQIVERQAYRQLMLANIRGHGLKFIADPDRKLRLVRDLEHGLATLERVDALYRELEGASLSAAVAARMERIPYPSSRMELAVCLCVCDMAERVAMEGYTESVSDEFAEIARAMTETEHAATRNAHALFRAFCVDESQRPHAQQMFGRWVLIALFSLGRPGTKRDKRAVELGLRTRSVAEALRLYLRQLEEFMQGCGLRLPDFAGTGVELPA